MNKRIIVLFVLLMTILSISAVSAENTGSFNELDTLIKDNVDTVELTKNYTRTDTDNTINITKDIIINGNGMVLDGNNKGQIMYIKDNLVVTINDVIFIRGNSQSGGALFIEGGTVILNNCKFLNNTASERGGAILNNGNLTIDKCVFDNNNITTRNSNSNYGGAAIAHMSATNILTVKNTNITNNLPNYTPRNGDVGDLNTGAIMVYGVSNFNNCNFLKNNGCYGGAITATGNKGAHVTIDNCNFDSNVAFNGGAISNVGSTIIVKNSKFINNKAIGSGSGGNPSVGGAIVTLASVDDRPAHLTIINSIFKNNHADSQGGAISGEYGNQTFKDCIFEGNTAEKSNGGAIELTLVNSFSAKIENCNFTNNKASSSGGAIYTTLKNSGTAISTGNEKLIINNSSFTDNFATNYGGAVYIGNKGDVNITNSVFTNNKADNKRISNTATGGAISTSSTTVNLGIKKSNFTNNAAGFYGGAVYAPNNGNLDIDQSVFTGNKIVTRYGGAVYTGSKGNVTVTNSKFTNNSAKSEGGALYILGSAATIEGSTINIKNDTFIDNVGSKGNAIYTAKNDTTLTNIISNGDIVAKKNIVVDTTGVVYITSTSVANITTNSSKEVIVSGTVSPTANGNVKVTIGTRTETGTVTNGVFNVNMGYFSAGSYEIIVKFIANTSYLASEGKGTLNVKSDIILEASDVVKYFKNGTQYTVRVTDVGGNPIVGKNVLVTLNSPNWSKNAVYNITTDSNGIATLIINLSPGKYSISANVDGESVKNTVTVMPTLTTENMVKPVNQPGVLLAKLVDGQGNPVSGKSITFTVKTKAYTKITDQNGDATLPINLGVGTWTINIANPETGAKTTSKIRITN